MNRKLSPERDLRAAGQSSYGGTFPAQAHAMAHQMSPTGYRGTEPTHDALVRKFQAENAAGMGPLLRAREMDEATCSVSIQHPMQDVPFWGEPIHFSTGDQNLAALATADYPIVTIGRSRVGFIRRIVPTPISVGSAAALRLTLLSDGSPLPGLMDVMPAALLDMGPYQNTYIRLMQNRSLTLRVVNDAAVIHTFRVSLFGWHYPTTKVIETARGVIPKDGV